MNRMAGRGLLVCIALGIFVWHWGRALLPAEEAPALFVAEPPLQWVALGRGFHKPGVYQISDGRLPESVIELTPKVSFFDDPFPIDLFSGELLEIVEEMDGQQRLVRCWMPAAHRVALGIPLHPDRMTEQDWTVLPGLGPKLAALIEVDRQQNGDFGSLEALDRVKGIAQGRIRRWRPFFLNSASH